MPSMPTHVVVEFKHPETGAILHRLDKVPVAVLMQIVGSAQQMKSMLGQSTQVISDVQRAWDGISKLMGGKKRR